MKARRLMIQDFDSTLDDGALFLCGAQNSSMQGLF